MCLLPFNLFRPIDEQRKGCFSCFSSVQLALHQLTLPQWLGLPVVFNFCKRVAVIPIVIMSSCHVVMSWLRSSSWSRHAFPRLYRVEWQVTNRWRGAVTNWRTGGWGAVASSATWFMSFHSTDKSPSGRVGVVGGWTANTDCKTSESGTRSTSAQNLDERIFMSVILFRNSNYTGILLQCWNVPKLVIVC